MPSHFKLKKTQIFNMSYKILPLPSLAPDTNELPLYPHENTKLYVRAVTLVVSSKWKLALDFPSCHLGLRKVSCSMKYSLTTGTTLPILPYHPIPFNLFTEHMPT